MKDEPFSNDKQQEIKSHKSLADLIKAGILFVKEDQDNYYICLISRAIQSSGPIYVVSKKDYKVHGRMYFTKFIVMEDNLSEINVLDFEKKHEDLIK